MFNRTIFTKNFAPRRQARKDLFKKLTAETQSTQREEVLPNRETTIGQKTPSLEETGFCLSSSPDEQKIKSLRLCGE